jgi:hypothetical protein
MAWDGHAAEVAVQARCGVDLCWTMAMLSVTLRQAIVLWSEEDPRVTSAEMELVKREA